MKRKNKIVPKKTLIIEPSQTMKRIGYFLAILGFLCAIVLVPDMKLDNVKGDSAPILIIVLILLMWVFIYLPYKAITAKKRLIIKGDKFILKSSKKGQSINTNINSMIWWRKIAPNPGLMDISNKIQINFKSKKIMLDDLEFKKFYELESFFETNFKEKEKKASR